MACAHDWIGTAEGVVCSKCGKALTLKEFRDLIKKAEEKKKKE